MKKILMAILTVIIAILISALVLYINVFSEKAKENIQQEERALINTQESNIEENEKEGYEKILSELEEKAKTDIESKEEITEAEIDEAITYIETNIEITAEEKNIENIKQMAYYGAYLKNLVKYESDEKKNEISILGENTLLYSKEALKFIEKQEKVKEDKNEETEIQEITDNSEETANQETPTEENVEPESVPEASATPIATPIQEPTETPVVINVIEVNTSTTLETAKTKVRSSISKVNNLNRKKLITELKEKI